MRRDALPRSTVAGMTRVSLRSLGGDALLALALAVAAFSAAASNHRSRDLLFALAAVGTGSLALRRVFPIAVLAISAAITSFVSFHYDHAWWPFGALIAFYTVAAHRPRGTAVLAGTAALVVLAVPVVYSVDWTPL